MKNTEMKELNLNEMEAASGGYILKNYRGAMMYDRLRYDYFILDDHTCEVLDYVEDFDDSYAPVLARWAGVSEQFITEEQYYRLRATGSI